MQLTHVFVISLMSQPPQTASASSLLLSEEPLGDGLRSETSGHDLSPQEMATDISHKLNTASGVCGTPNRPVERCSLWPFHLKREVPQKS